MEASRSAERSAGSLRASTGPHDADLRLARAALAGDPAARHAFVERMACVPKFLAVINARIGRPLSEDELEDVVQTTLTEIWRRLDTYTALASIETWAYRFCQRILFDRVRALGRRPRSVELVDAQDGRSHLEPWAEYEHVYLALEKLDELGARIVRHKHFDQWTFEEIGRRLSIPTSSAKAHYHRAITRLREILDPLRREAGL